MTKVCDLSTWEHRAACYWEKSWEKLQRRQEYSSGMLILRSLLDQVQMPSESLDIHMSLEFRGEAQVADINLGAVLVSVQVAFKTSDLDKSSRK